MKASKGKGCRQGSWQSRGLAHLAQLRLGGAFYTTEHCSHVQRHTVTLTCVVARRAARAFST
eukprot:scaffold16470_cov120-Isochrysis_galbana.AAC.5